METSLILKSSSLYIRKGPFEPNLSLKPDKVLHWGVHPETFSNVRGTSLNPKTNLNPFDGLNRGVHPYTLNPKKPFIKGHTPKPYTLNFISPSSRAASLNPITQLRGKSLNPELNTCKDPALRGPYEKKSFEKD